MILEETLNEDNNRFYRVSYTSSYLVYYSLISFNFETLIFNHFKGRLYRIIN